MKIIQRYLAREILIAVGLVLAAFLALYVFFDFINELNDVGKNGYRVEHAAIMVLLEIPARAYELLPIAALIGTIYALSQLASRSEFTIMRMAGLSTGRAARMVLLPGLLLVVLTYLLGEIVTPAAENLTQTLHQKISSGNVKQNLRSGLWLKDTVRDTVRDSVSTTRGQASELLVRYINIGEVLPNRDLQRVRIYEFDGDLHLRSIAQAQHAEYSAQQGGWILGDVTETLFALQSDSVANPASTAASDAATSVASLSAADVRPVSIRLESQKIWRSELKPALLNVLQIAPERMAARNLNDYIHHLEENKQKTERYEIAFWKKLIYPLAVLVMMALALPFAYLHVRAGGISFKIFAGIMLGIGFYLLNSLFSHLGLLNTWPPFLSAAIPSLFTLILAMLALRWVERH